MVSPKNNLGKEKYKISMFKSLKLQFVFYFLIFSFIPLVIFSILGFFLNRVIIENIHTSYLHYRSIQLSNQVKTYFAAKDEEAKTLFLLSKFNQSARNWNKLTTREIRSLFAQIPEYIVYLNGTFTEQNANPELESYFQNALKKTNYHLILTPGKRFYYISVLADNLFLFQAIPNREIYDVLNFSDPSDIISLVSKAGNYTISGDSVAINTKYQNLPSKNFNNLLTANPVQISGDLILFLSKSREGIDRDLKSFLTEILIADFLIGLLMLLSAVFFSRRIITPIDSLVKAVKKISKGDLNEPIEVKSHDEIRALADEFEKMRLKLRESYVDLENKIVERTEALRDAQFQISHQEKMASLGLLAAGVAHEIGNPLTSISSMAQIIKRKVKDQNFIEYLNTILKNIERIRKIVRELVDFARPSSYEAADTNINEIIRNAVGIVKYDRRAKSINIDLELDNDLPSVFLVADQLLQVFINILINAVDALTEDRNRIIIRSKKEGINLLIQFEDEGVGIKPEDISKIFEPFYTTKKVGKGTGLGLSVTYGIIKNLNGDIDVQSEPGKGTIFTISLPRTAGSN